MAIILVLAVGVCAIGCGEKTTGAGASASGASGPSMARFRIGHSVAPDRTVTVETDYFGRGESIYVSFEVKNVPPKSQAKVVWSDSSKRKISEETKPLASGTGAVAFEMKDASSAAAGDYLAEFFYGDPEEIPEKWLSLGAHSFRIAPNRSS